LGSYVLDLRGLLTDCNQDTLSSQW